MADPLDLAPALAHNLPAAAAQDPPPPARVPREVDAYTLEALDADPNDLKLQRWGVIAPAGPAGDAALEALSPLLRLRETEQAAKVKIYRDAPLQASIEDAFRWKNDIWQQEEESERPRYLLLVGDADQLSFELQHVLGNGALVGRVHAATLDDHAAYSNKVVYWAERPGDAVRPDALFFVADDDSDATSLGRSLLVEPCLNLARSATRFPARQIAQLAAAATASDFVRAAERSSPAVLLSVSHGLGPPRRGWSQRTEQRALQGALLVSGDGPSPRDRLVTAEQLRGATFLPGGLWFCLACFGAGTPQESAFQPWLSRLKAAAAYADAVSGLVERLPAVGDPPFVAAMPQAALASPGGPLAVIGHVDLAWTYGFVDRDQPSQSRAARIFSSIQVMVRGSRAGVALDALMRSYRQANDELVSLYDEQERARQWRRPDPVDPAHLARAFMARNDLRGYVLLGDPAVRLPLAGATAA